MPVALRIGSYLFLFWRGDGRAGILRGVEIKRMVEDNRDLLLQKWYEHFGGEN